VAATELTQSTVTERGEVQPHDAVIAAIQPPAHESGVLRSIDEPDRAVVLQQQRVGYLADRRAPRIRVATDREQELVLRRGQSRGNRLLLAPLQEPPKPGAELEEALKVSVGNLSWHIYIVTR
jgi:hypothetical protein